MAITLETPAYYYIPLIIIGDMFFIFGTSKLLATMADDVRAEIQALNEQQEIGKNIHKIVEMHSTIKQLSEKGTLA